MLGTQARDAARKRQPDVSEIRDVTLCVLVPVFYTTRVSGRTNEERAEIAWNQVMSGKLEPRPDKAQSSPAAICDIRRLDDSGVREHVPERFGHRLLWRSWRLF